MANVTTIQILEDGPQKVVAHVVGSLDTSDLALTTILDPAALSATNPASTQLRIDRIQFDVKGPLAVQLVWDATTPVVAYQCVGNGYPFDAVKFGGIVNNSGAGKTGKLQISSVGWAGVLQFSLTVECTKE